jgi:hypothetical protein
MFCNLSSEAFYKEEGFVVDELSTFRPSHRRSSGRETRTQVGGERRMGEARSFFCIAPDNPRCASE